MSRFPATLFLQIPTPGPATVAAGPVRHHVRILEKNGVSYRQAGDLAGVSHGRMRALMYGRSGTLPSRVSRDTAERLLAVHPEEGAPQLVPALGTHRRIQALMVCGWSQAKLAAHIDWSVSAFKELLNRTQVRPGTEATVRRLFNDLWDVTPPRNTPADRAAAQRATSRALTAGWLPPLAWDDDDIDTAPTPPRQTRPRGAGPDIDWVAVDYACDGHTVHLNQFERAESIRRLHGRYLSDKQIAATLGARAEAIQKSRKVLALPARINYDQTLVTA